MIVTIIGTLQQTPSAQAAVSGYKLPWPAGQQAYMTSGSSGHNGELALDFDIGGSGSAGQIRAAKSGRIVFRKDTSRTSCIPPTSQTPPTCNWQYANMIVIQSAPNEYVWYMHIAPNSIPVSLQEGSTVDQGAILGIEGNTGWATAVHLHIQVTSTYGGTRDVGDLRAPIWQTTFQEINFDEYSWATIQQAGWKISQNNGGSSTCPAPSLNTPSAGQVLNNRSIAFSWQALTCGNGYTLRIKDTSSMDSGGTTIFDQGIGELSRTADIPEQWLNRTLYWGVRAANAQSATWAVRSFRIEPSSPPLPAACTPSADQVTIFENAGYGGQCVTLGIDQYSDSGQMNFANDAVSSIRVGTNVRAILYEHGAFAGRSEIFTGDDNNLTDNTIGNDSVSSMRIERRTSAEACPAPLLAGPADGATIQDPNIIFSWSAPSGCSFSGYTFRIKDSSSMEQGGTVLVDTGVGSTSIQSAIAAQWQNHDLYWGVRTANPLSPNWSVRRFRVEPPNNSEIDPQSISNAQTIDARIDPPNEDDTYTFAGTQGQVAVITMDRTDASQLDSYIELFGPTGLVGYDDDSAGSLNSRMEMILPQTGNYRILAHSYAHNTAGAYRIRMTLSAAPSGDGDDGRWLSLGQSLAGTVTPSSDRDTYYFSAVAGRTISLRMNKRVSTLDSYLELYDPAGTKIAENDDSGGDLNSWLVASLPSAGNYRIVARSYNGSSSGAYTIALEALSGGNLARGTVAYASSVEGNSSNLTPIRTTDGNLTTRWSSAFSDNQWLYVDLGSNRSINQVVLRWENAFADRYDIYVRSTSETSWRQVYSTNSGDGNLDTITFSMATARYVLMQGRHRYAHNGWQQFGYSLWEIEVYNTLSALIPTVPPDTTTKADETLVPLVPLPPDPIGKDPSGLSQGTQQENQPLATTPSAEQPVLNLGEVYGPPSTGISVSPDRTIVGDTQIHFTAIEPYDTDQAGNGIVAYEWLSDIDGFLGSTAELHIAATRLSIGLHTITLTVQDNEGNWSAPVTALVEILPSNEGTTANQYHVYLPLVER